MALVKFNKTTTYTVALTKTTDNVIYFTTDNHHIVLNGVDYTGSYEDGNNISY